MDEALNIPRTAGTVRLAVSRRDDAFVRAYDDHAGQVYGFFGYRLGSRAEAEDLTQATFERALRAWGRFDPRRGSVKTWLFSIANNLLVDHHRRGRSTRERPVGLGPEVADARSGGYELDERVLGPSPEVEAALAELGDRERELVALRFGGELSGAEISRVTGLSRSNVDQIMSRTLRLLRSRLDQTSQAMSGRRRPTPDQPAANGPAPARPTAAIASSTNPHPA
jgi:RNA polymerase sigma-70 factor (ECF subfamily)